MRKFISVLLCVLMFAFSVVPSFSAYRSEREYFEDGSYIIVSDRFAEDGTASDEENDVAEDAEAFSFLKLIRELIRKIIELFKNHKTVTETKYVSYYSSDGKLLWTATVTADFSYNGKSSVCDSVKTGCNIYDSDWTLISKECSKNGNTATAYFKVRQHKLGVPLKVIEKTVTLTCDKDGNIK